MEAAALCRPGQIIEIADPVRAGVRRAGRIMGVNGTNQITIDDTSITDLPNDAVSYTRTLHVIMPNGTVSTNTVASISGNTITVVGNFVQKYRIVTIILTIIFYLLLIVLIILTKKTMFLQHKQLHLI